MQAWIGLDDDGSPSEDITFTYGENNGNGEGGFATVGAENKFGNKGEYVYADGTGTLPVEGTEILVHSTPGTIHSVVVSFDAKAQQHHAGPWRNCATMTSSGFLGTSYSCVSGTIHWPDPLEANTSGRRGGSADKGSA